MPVDPLRLFDTVQAIRRAEGKSGVTIPARAYQLAESIRELEEIGSRRDKVQDHNLDQARRLLVDVLASAGVSRGFAEQAIVSYRGRGQT